MKIVFIGSVEFSQKTLKKLIELKADIAGVLTKKSSNFNADFLDLTPICLENNIKVRYVDNINNLEHINWIRNLNPDVIFCFGWSSLLKSEILHLAPMGVIGYHPALLPENRGRHPVIWTLVMGLDKTGSSFFFMDEGADSGDILSQHEIEVTYEDNARTLYDKIIDTALRQIEEFLPELTNNIFTKKPQDNRKANYWRKRDREDGRIDFRMNSRAIYNLVRGLSRPYVGAHIVYKKEEIKVWKAKEINFTGQNIEYGKVLDIINNHILIKCYDKAILLTEHEFTVIPAKGEYIK